MNLRPREFEQVEEEGWQVVGNDWWITPFDTVSWAYNHRETTPGETSNIVFHGSLFVAHVISSSANANVGRPRHFSDHHENDLTLSTSLCGVQCATDSIAAYEANVGFSSAEVDTKLPPEEQHADISIAVKEEAILQGKQKWSAFVESLTGLGVEEGPGELSRPSSPSSSHGGPYRSTSTLSSGELTDSESSFKSLSVPTTPKRKGTDTLIEAREISPKSTDGKFVSFQSSSLNAFASSFVPSFMTSPLVAKSQEDPYASGAVDVSSQFICASDVPPLPSPKVQKDEEGFYTGTEVASPVPLAEQKECAFLPPFLKDSPRRRGPASKTRAIVDRLRSSHNHSLSPAPNPPLYDLDLLDERVSVSEDDKPIRQSGFSSPSQDDDDDGWINIAEASKESKASRTKNLFMALTRRWSGSDSPPSNHANGIANDLGAAIPATPVATLPPSFLPPASTTEDGAGWIEGSLPTNHNRPQPQKTNSRSRSHRRRRSSHVLPMPLNAVSAPFVSPAVVHPPRSLSHVPYTPGTVHCLPTQPVAPYLYGGFTPMMTPVAYTSYIQQLQLIQIGMRNVGGSAPHTSAPVHSAEWIQFSTASVTEPFIRPAPLVASSSIQRDAW